MRAVGVQAIFGLIAIETHTAVVIGVKQMFGNWMYLYRDNTPSPQQLFHRTGRSA